MTTESAGLLDRMELISPADFAKEKVQDVQDYTLLAGQAIANLFRRPLYVADMLYQAGKYKGGAVRLCSCSTGAAGATAAQEFADELGEHVLAPTDTLWMLKNGRLVIGPDHETPTGYWKRFFPRDREQ